MENITQKDISNILIDFYGKLLEPEFKAIRRKLEEHDRKFKEILDLIENWEKRLKTFS